MTQFACRKSFGSIRPDAIRSITVRVPGSSANLGPGFDALALAYDIYCDLKLELTPNPSAAPRIELSGKYRDLPTDETNLIYRVLKGICGDGELLHRLKITIDSQIPLGRGLGSSAAAIVGAVWGGCALSALPLETSALLSRVEQIEGHADNGAASLLGGLVVTSSQGRRVVTQQLQWPKEWKTIVLVPPYALSTKTARAVLPRTVTRADAVSNVQNVSLLLAAVSNQDEDAMRYSLQDKLHEPYRMALVPELAQVRKAVSGLPILGCVLSGAGPSVLTLCHQRHRQQVMQCLADWIGTREGYQLLDLSVDQQGLKISYE